VARHAQNVEPDFIQINGCTDTTIENTDLRVIVFHVILEFERLHQTGSKPHLTEHIQRVEQAFGRR
jgi:hypothetical protein